MMTALRDRLAAMAMIGLLALALVATGFGHRVPSADGLRLEALSLALGVGAGVDLCTDRDGDGVVDHGRCPACQIAGSFLPPVPPAAAPRDLVLVLALDGPALAFVPRAHPRDPAHGLRAPPALI